MEFFERKEEILDIQLTEYGKQKITEGRFKPIYYAFFDDDIIYDTAYSGYSERQNKDQDRILGAIRPKLQTNIAGIETTVGQNKEIQSEGDKFNFLVSILGNAETGNDSIPAWSIRFFNENLVRVIQRPTGSYFAYNTIPQLNATVDYRTFINEEDSKSKNLLDANIFPDGTFIDLEEDSLFIRIVENNTLFSKENFEIEIFELETQTVGTNDTKEILKPLEFSNNNNIENTDSVEYFLEVNIDTEVDSEEFCAKVPQNERTLYFVDRIHDCSKLEEEKRVRQDIYDENESGEIC